MNWPKKYNIIGVEVSALTLESELEAIFQAAKGFESTCVSHLAVHGIVEASKNSEYNEIIRNFEIVAPDGFPVKFALNTLHKVQLPERVSGPDFMLKAAERAVKEKIKIYLYGSTDEALKKLKKNLVDKFPGLDIAGSKASLFRPLTPSEDKELIKEINNSEAGITFIGLGCPLQEKFAYEHKSQICSVMVCVGAAFDFHAGVKKRAPLWMQKSGLEWLFRLLSEPKRLAKRYFITNTIFISRFILQFLKIKNYKTS